MMWNDIVLMYTKMVLLQYVYAKCITFLKILT